MKQQGHCVSPSILFPASWHFLGQFQPTFSILRVFHKQDTSAAATPGNRLPRWFMEAFVRFPCKSIRSSSSSLCPFGRNEDVAFFEEGDSVTGLVCTAVQPTHAMHVSLQVPANRASRSLPCLSSLFLGFLQYSVIATSLADTTVSTANRVAKATLLQLVSTPGNRAAATQPR